MSTGETQPNRDARGEKKLTAPGSARRQTGHDERGSDCAARETAAAISLEPATDNSSYERRERHRRRWNTGESGAAYNLNSIYTDGTTFTSDGLDGAGYAYSSNLLTPNRMLNGIQFNFGPANQPDAVYGDRASRLRLPAGHFATLQLLAGGIYGPVLDQAITVTYTDGSTSVFTQNFNDWCSCGPNPGDLAGRTSSGGDALSRFTRRHGRITQESYLYGYSFALNPAKTVQSLACPTIATSLFWRQL